MNEKACELKRASAPSRPYQQFTGGAATALQGLEVTEEEVVELPPMAKQHIYFMEHTARRVMEDYFKTYAIRPRGATQQLLTMLQSPIYWTTADGMAVINQVIDKIMGTY